MDLAAVTADPAPRAAAPRRALAADGAEDREILFCLLSHCLGWMEAAEAVEEVMGRFGGLAAAIAAEEADLAALPALGEAGAATLKAVQAAALRIGPRRPRDQPALRDAAAVLAHLRRAGAAPAGGELRALFLDARGALLADELVAGAVAADAVPGRVLRRAVALEAAGLVLLRGGDPAAPSAESALALAVARAGRVMGIRLVDHLVLDGEAHASLRAEGLLDLPADA